MIASILAGTLGFFFLKMTLNGKKKPENQSSENTPVL